MVADVGYAAAPASTHHFSVTAVSGSTAPSSRPLTASLGRPVEVSDASSRCTRQLGAATLYVADKSVLL
jgi:hypothetical protein